MAESLGLEEPLVLSRLKQVQQQNAFPARYNTAKTGETAPAAVNAPSAEEDLLCWLLKSPQHTVLCSELKAEHFSSPALWEIFKTIVQTHLANPQAENLTDLAAQALPKQKSEIAKLALLPTPDDFDPARDIAACAAKLEQAGLQQQLTALTRQMKTYGTGNVPPEVFQTYMQLQRKLKQYRS